ncbi:MAG: 3-deoxy-7-phosphoheptulonate synthase [Holophaga sp.]|nr:3-deoxy-7-phosphoheptulonate synthase [Holophaga sp.]
MDPNTETLTHATLDKAREAILATDRELVHLLARRFETVRQVAEVKRAEDSLPLLDEARERAVQETWLQDSEALGLSAPFARRILKEILNHSRRIQEPILEAHEASTRRSRVGFQGIAGAHSALAAAHLMAMRSNAGAELQGYPTFQDAVVALQNGEVRYALLPVENSIGGSIQDVNRLVCDQSLHIVDEEVWEVEHVLAALPGAALESIQTVRSHAAALIQCETFLRGLVGVEAHPWFDTAGAAASLGASDMSVAVLCSEEAAVACGLVVLARHIADHDRNETRFVLLAMEPETPDSRLPCKTSLLLRLNHHEGSLARALAAFAESRVNLTRIESRPQPETPWEYLFFVDVEGHQGEPHLKAALARVRACCNHLRVLGSFPNRSVRQEAHLDGPRPEAILCPMQPPMAVLPPAQDHLRSSFHLGNVVIGDGRFVLISGPCAIESREQILEAAAMVKAAGAAVLRGGAFKPRTSPYAFQGLGLEGLRYLREAGRHFDLPVVTEVLTIEDISIVAAHADVLQVGARNMHNFALLKELGRLDKPVILKRGMSATVKEFLLAAEYILAGGNQQVILCERGIRTFETGTRATLDLAAIPILKRATHLPVIVDPSHAAGDRLLVVPLALAAAAAGADGLIVEAHPHPETALCDKEQALTREDLEQMVAGLKPIVASQGRRW